MFNTFIEPLEAEFGITSNHRIGRFSDVSDSQEYTDRIEAINFALAHDDGQSAKNLAEADVILVGVSRSGKTPTSLYLAMQHGIKAANYPLIPEDFERGKLPSTLTPFKAKCFGLTIDPERLRPHPQRAPAEQQVRVDRELPLRGARGRDDDEAGRHRLAVVDAQVDRGDRDHDPARPQAGSAGVLSAAWRRKARRTRLQSSSAHIADPIGHVDDQGEAEVPDRPIGDGGGRVDRRSGGMSDGIERRRAVLVRQLEMGRHRRARPGAPARRCRRRGRARRCS